MGTLIPETPRKAKLMKKLKVLRMQLQREKKKTNVKTVELKNALTCIAEYLSPDTVSFLESQVEMSK